MKLKVKKKKFSFNLNLFFHFIVENKLYEVVLTTYDGLYRYRTEDIIKITGHYYTLPTWQLIGRYFKLKKTKDYFIIFSFRRGQYLSISNEHVTEIELREIINSILSEYKKEFTSSSPQYSVFIDKSSYVLSIEVDDDKKDRLKQLDQEIISKFDENLQESNEDYKSNREKKKISLPNLYWLKYNTLTTGTRDYRLDPKKMGHEKSNA